MQHDENNGPSQSDSGDRRENGRSQNGLHRLNALHSRYGPVLHTTEPSEAELRSMVEEYGRAVDALEISEGEWIDLARDSDVSVRRSALTFLLSSNESGRRLRGSRIVRDRLVEMLRDDTRLTLGVLNALHGIREQASVPMMIELLHTHPDYKIRYMAARALGERAGEVVEEALRTYLANEDLMEGERRVGEQALAKVIARDGGAAISDGKSDS